jgi:hypothetical protein
MEAKPLPEPPQESMAVNGLPIKPLLSTVCPATAAYRSPSSTSEGSIATYAAMCMQSHLPNSPNFPVSSQLVSFLV